MGPKRKKSKPNSDETGVNASGSTPNTTEPTVETTQTDPATPHTIASPTPSRSSWYGGSWRGKATPVAQIRKESISVAQGATSESSETTRPPNSVSKSVRGSRKSIPLAAEATRVHAISDVGDKSRPRFPSEEKLKGIEGTGEAKPEVVVEEARLPPEPAPKAAILGDGEKRKTASRPESGAWFGWWSRPDGYGSDGEKSSKKLKLTPTAEEASNTPLPGTPVAEPIDPIQKNAQDFEGVGGTAEASKPDSTLQLDANAPQMSSKSWFGLWSTAQNQQAAPSDQAQQPPPPPPEINISAEPTEAEAAVKQPEPSKTDQKAEAEDQPQPSGWAFWSNDRSKDLAPTPGGTQKQIGELAVADTPSQSNPEAAQFNEQREKQKTSTKSTLNRSSSLLKPTRGRPDKVKESSGESSATPSPAGRSAIPSPAVSQIPTPSETPSQSDTETAPVNRGKQTRPNLILPTFRTTYPPVPNPGYMERLTQYLAQSLKLPASATPSPPPQHVYVSPSLPRIRKAVALGVHGFFPAPLIQKVLGQPTGTSIRFANYAAQSIKTWCQTHQPDIRDVEIEKVALEGEGYIADRVTTLWKLLLNWLSHLRQADFILVACHSQGVPVAIMLVAKLIELGCLSPTCKIGVCAMAGISLGPFLEYRSRLFGGTALELFEFCDSSSTVSKSYASSLEVCLRHGVRVTFVGSIDDQLVSLESSLYAPLSHPYVNRAVFIDGRLHGTPNFLTHLVVFALKLRNLGYSDHGLIRELSAPLAGSLVGGDGHSRVYDDPAVYTLAVEYALESTSLLSDTTTATATTPAPIITPYAPPSSAVANPFYLPFAVRGVLEEDIIKRDGSLREEVGELVREFDAWRPTSKVLRDVRWRLEGVRGMGS